MRTFWILLFFFICVESIQQTAVFEKMPDNRPTNLCCELQNPYFVSESIWWISATLSSLWMHFGCWRCFLEETLGARCHNTSLTLGGFSQVNTLRPRQDGRYFADDVLKCIFLNENMWISLMIPLKFVVKGPINNIPALVQIMAWHQPGTKPLSEPMLVFVLTHICVTWPQLVNSMWTSDGIWHHGHCSILVNTLRMRQNGHDVADDIFKCIFLNEIV